VAFFCIAAQEIVIVTSPEPTAITDAYALIKVLFTKYQEKTFRVLVNSAKNSREGMEVFKRLSLAAERFLNISLDYLGYIPYDESVPKAVRQQKAFVEIYPQQEASRQIFELAAKLAEGAAQVKGSLQFFIGNLVSASTNAG
jgi:flagellar biosynthesis protein FlhG